VVEGKKDKTTGCERLLEFSTAIFTAVENTNPLSSGIPLLPLVSRSADCVLRTVVRREAFNSTTREKVTQGFYTFQEKK
jgi:hypothetical protein